MHYLEVYLHFINEPKEPFTAVQVKNQVKIAVEHLLGTEGVQKFDLLKYNKQKKKFILRCDSNDYVKLRAALTVASSFEGEPCSFNVTRATPNLLSLSANSRTYHHQHSINE
ncbi:hypothetical protein TKK_0009795 [Trichogramma kaykai]|uniref:Uncharacterized protein n=1 Tax=Trichogramma kaykai TaxID=54128 RepID=A0ABD2X191_9HYME